MELQDLVRCDPSWCKIIIVWRQCRVVPQTNIARHVRQQYHSMRTYKAAAIKLFEQSFDHLPLIQDPDEILERVRPLLTASS